MLFITKNIKGIHLTKKPFQKKKKRWENLMVGYLVKFWKIEQTKNFSVASVIIEAVSLQKKVFFLLNIIRMFLSDNFVITLNIFHFVRSFC